MLRKLIHGSFFNNNTITQGNILEYLFGKLRKALIKLYCTNTDLKGDVIEYLKSDKCKKPKGKSVSDDQDRMEEIIGYSRCLEGATNNLSEDKIKKILFTLFPVVWQINYFCCMGTTCKYRTYSITCQNSHESLVTVHLLLVKQDM